MDELLNVFDAKLFCASPVKGCSSPSPDAATLQRPAVPLGCSAFGASSCGAFGASSSNIGGACRFPNAARFAGGASLANSALPEQAAAFASPGLNLQLANRKADGNRDGGMHAARETCCFSPAWHSSTPGAWVTHPELWEASRSEGGDHSTSDSPDRSDKSARSALLAVPGSGSGGSFDLGPCDDERGLDFVMNLKSGRPSHHVRRQLATSEPGFGTQCNPVSGACKCSWASGDEAPNFCILSQGGCSGGMSAAAAASGGSSGSDGIATRAVQFSSSSAVDTGAGAVSTAGFGLWAADIYPVSTPVTSATLAATHGLTGASQITPAPQPDHGPLEDPEDAVCVVEVAMAAAVEASTRPPRGCRGGKHRQKSKLFQSLQALAERPGASAVHAAAARAYVDACVDAYRNKLHRGDGAALELLTRHLAYLIGGVLRFGLEGVIPWGQLPVPAADELADKSRTPTYKAWLCRLGMVSAEVFEEAGGGGGCGGWGLGPAGAL